MVGIYLALVLVAAGVLLMAATGVLPTDPAALDLGRLPADLVPQPAGFLWTGILIVLATPLTRVLVALRGYLRAGEREMALVSVTILAVISLGVALGTLGG
jgi:uncharacterized membrane protein